MLHAPNLDGKVTTQIMKRFFGASTAFAAVCVLSTLTLSAWMFFGAGDSARSIQPVSRSTQSEAVIAAPSVLTLADRLTYRNIFTLQKNAQWKDADRSIAQLRDPLLMGYVLAERYLHREYRSTPRELSFWLSRYHDLPQASALHALAVRKGVKHLRTPDNNAHNTPQKYARNNLNAERFGSSLVNRHLKGSPLRAEIKSRLVSGSRAQALAILQQTPHVSLRDYDLLRWYIAGSHFNNGEYAQAASLAHASAMRSGAQFPVMHWVAGVSYWHQHNYERAYQHFSAMASTNQKLNHTDAAAAAFWAYRAAKEIGGNEQADKYLTQAASYADTFYGIQAAEAVTRQKMAEMGATPLTQHALESLMRKKALRRVLALREIERRDEAVQELKNHYATLPVSAQPAAYNLARILDLPATDIYLASVLKHEATPQISTAYYPTPNLRPRNGYAIDPSLIYAIARQESGFNVAARSPVGAAGIMQIMPETARYLLNRTGSGGNLDTVMRDPHASVALGQQYISYLQKQPAIGDNLIYLIASYNAGPSPLQKWKRELNHQNDPLLFVESIPFVETRGYVLNVLTNYWIYSDLIGTDNPSVLAMVDGKWPLYQTSKQQIASITENLTQIRYQKNAL